MIIPVITWANIVIGTTKGSWFASKKSPNWGKFLAFFFIYNFIALLTFMLLLTVRFKVFKENDWVEIDEAAAWGNATNFPLTRWHNYYLSVPNDFKKEDCLHLNVTGAIMKDNLY